MTMTKFNRVASAALLAVLVGCGGALAQNRLDPLNPPKTVRVGTVGQASDAGLYVALEKGYFKELGLNVELVKFASAAQMISPLGSGHLDVGGGAVSAGLWNAETRKIGIRAVADKGSTRKDWSYFALVTKKDGPIKECKDLKGKKISNASNSNAVLHSIDVWLSKCGLSLKDVEVKVLGYADVTAALSNGGIDAGHLGEPLITLNEQKGLIRVLARESDLRPSEQVALLYYSSAFVGDKPAAQRFMVAYVKGVKDYLAAYAKGRPPEQWFIDVMLKHTRVSDPKLFATVVPAGLDSWAEMDIKSMKSDFEWFKKNKLIVDNDIAFEAPLDTSFTDFAKAYLSKAGKK